MAGSEPADRDPAPRTTRFRSTFLSASALRLHLTLVVAGGGCLLAGRFELTRALAGREVAWVYAVEWPFFAVIGCWLWWRLLHAPGQPAAGQTAGPPAAGPQAFAHERAAPAGDDPASDESDPELIAWQQYLARLHAVDPPGVPPVR